jgi:DNA-directed RNA polymerase subunit M/transcription elongation factor TFIIS
MPIRIKCPKCQTILGVKETLAGKKANCPKCRYLLSIPVPKAKANNAAGPTAEDAEALALSAFAEEAPKPVTTKTIEFECPFCMEMVKVSADLSGKQTPCPNAECKRIVKVPLLKADKPKDWRAVDPRAPIAALMKDGTQAPPDNAWSTSQKTRVSTDALIEADAIPIQKIPLTRRDWIRRGILAAVALLMVGGGGWYFMSSRSSSKLEGPLNEAVAQANSNPKLKPAAAAYIFRGAGEFHGMRGKAPLALDHFNFARAKFGEKMHPDADRDTALIAVALALIDLGGTPKNEEDESRVDWATVQKNLGQLLASLSSVPAKQTGMREVGSRLIAKDKGDIAVALASQLAQPEPGAARSPLDAQHIAFLCATAQAAEAGTIRPLPGTKKVNQPPAPEKKEVVDKDKDDDKDKDRDKDQDKPKEEAKPQPQPQPQPNEGEIDSVAQLGYAEAKAFEDNFEEARQLAKHNGPALGRLEASIAVAAIAADKNKTADTKASAKDALEIYKELEQFKEAEKSKLPPAWLVIQLTRVCVRAGMAEDAKKVANSLTEPQDKEAKALANLELILPQLESGNTAVPVTVLEDLSDFKDTLAYGLALEMIARRNTRLGKQAEILATMQGLDDAQKAFVQIGIALGQLDAAK